jgi:hypothetical protein
MATLQDALEVVESLPLEQQEELIQLLQHRHSEDAREQLVEDVKAAQAAYARGEVHRGTAEDLIRELSK